MVSFEPIKMDVLSECEDDYVRLWSVVRDVRDHMPTASRSKVRDTTLHVVKELLHSRLIGVGSPTSKGRSFTFWQLAPNEAVNQIKSQWQALGRAPDIGEIAWFTSIDE